MRKFNVAGFQTCSAYQQAKNALLGLSVIFPHKVAVNVQEYETRDEYMSWLSVHRETISAPTHKTSPIVWFDDGKYLGGRDDTLGKIKIIFIENNSKSNYTTLTRYLNIIHDTAWCRQYLTMPEGNMNTTVINKDEVNASHAYDYDLVVIGGGSGGLACSKEAQKLGAKVAVLDFVKPSPLGTKWGLGGTCVNVGCIPKKLMHTAALMGEFGEHAKSYGWKNGSSTHDWETMRENVQNHIKGLNFGYRVQLREAGVTYLNKLGKFISPNQLECTDAKGNVQIISAARFVVAVGGRPTPLECPGAELAISSDDLFSKETPLGKTCVVGAGYVALECAGFITGLRQGEVTVLVRSIPLRGFDRDTVDRVVQYMESNGTRIIQGVQPASIEKLSSGKLLVRFTNGASDEFDTVLAAVGRMADTAKLGLENVGVKVNPNNKKMICTNEQSNIPHIYGIGDVVDGTPELTPVAILAGKLLAQRLFADSPQLMSYKDIATTVFTPLELGTIGYSEEEAISKFGADAIDSFVSAFTPLEWSVVDKHSEGGCFAKVVVNTKENNKILGMHIAAPNAGEIIQGFAVAFRKGITHKDLLDTVGIHPTTAEEFTTMVSTRHTVYPILSNISHH